MKAFAMKTRLLIILVLLISFLAWTPIESQAVVRHRRHKHTRSYYLKHRSKKKQAAIIGGTAAGGAAIGALAGGGKGALIGAGVGAAGGAVYNQKTKNKRVPPQ